MVNVLEESMRASGMNTDDYVELTCPTEGCRKPQIARPVGGTIVFDTCPCGFQAELGVKRLFMYAYGAPPFWFLVHKDDQP